MEKEVMILTGLRTNRYGDSPTDGIWNEDCSR